MIKILPKYIVENFYHAKKINKPNFPFKDDVALMFLWLIYSYGQKNRDSKNGNYKSYVSLCDDLLQKNIHENRKLYLDWHIENNLVEKINYCYTTNSCAKYRLVMPLEEYQSMDTIEFEIKHLKSRQYLNKVYSWCPTADKNCKHLKKWFNEGLKVDVELAKSLIKEKTNNTSNNQSNYYLNVIDNINRGQFWGSMNMESDQRLHTNLSNFPKFLKSCLSYNDEPLIGVDIQTSQPFFLLVILQKIISAQNNNHINLNNQEGFIPQDSLFENNLNSGLISFITSISSRSIDMSEFEYFKKLVLEEDLYTAFGNKLTPKKAKNGQYVKYKFNGKVITDIEYYKDLRAYAKSEMFLIIYGRTPKVKQQGYKVFEKMFPMITKIIEYIKSPWNKKDKEPHKKLSKVLQNIEAHCILKFVTKKISKELPKMVMYTVHDSIATTYEFIDILQDRTKEFIKEYSGLTPKLPLESWGDNNQIIYIS